MAASAGAWYRVGTVNVTNGSAAIVGAGSNWQNDVIAIAIGDAFTIDAKTWYEVIAVNSDTSITLDRGFEGSTDNGVEYAILRNTSGTILTRIAGQIAVQFNQKQLFLDELRNWLTSEDDTATLTDSHGIEHVVKTVNKIQEITGTAADTDKVVNSVDATAGRLTSVGWGGIGGARISKQAYGNDLLNLAAENDYNGWIVEVSVDTANKPPMGPNNLAGHVIRVQNTLLMIAGYPFSEQGNVFIGYWDGAAIDWRKQFDSFNSVNPIDYGIGKQAVAFTDWNTIPLDFSGFGLVAFQADNTPAGISENYTYAMFVTGGSSADSVILMAQGQSLTYKARRDSQGAWVVDGEIFNSSDVVSSSTDTTAGKLLTVGSFGLGQMSQVYYPASSHNDTDIPSGLYRYTNPITDRPSVIGPLGYIAIERYSSSTVKQTITDLDGNLAYRSWDGANGDWRLNYDSGNTNFNDFGGFAVNDYICRAFKRSGTAALLSKSISGSLTPPTSLAVSGIYKIVVTSTGIAAVTGIPASKISLLGNTSSKELVMVINEIDASPLATDISYTLSAESSDCSLSWS